MWRACLAPAPRSQPVHRCLVGLPSSVRLGAATCGSAASLWIMGSPEIGSQVALQARAAGHGRVIPQRFARPIGARPSRATTMRISSCQTSSL
eukprot:11103910-Alexandrium_andersonii.AAC.1